MQSLAVIHGRTLERELASYQADDSGAVLAEFVLIFPLLIVMIFGIWDLGNGLWVGQKVIKSAYTVADLLGRQVRVDDDEIAQAFKAGELALLPFPVGSYEVEVVSVSYDEDGTPDVVWDDAFNTVVAGDLAQSTEGMGVEGDGTLAVRVSYTYSPTFAGFVIDEINMQETAYVRGRKSAIVSRE